MQLAELNAVRLAPMLKALSNPVRLEIFQTLTACGEAKCIDFTRQRIDLFLIVARGDAGAMVQA